MPNAHYENFPVASPLLPPALRAPVRVIYAFARREKAVEDANKPAYVQKWVPSYHKVTRGQTLYSIARRYGVTVKQIKAWNGLKSSTAPLGRTLIIYKMQWVNNRQG